MQATPVSPTRLVIDCSPEEEAELRKLLTYKDKKISFSLMKLKKNRWLADRIGVEQWQKQIQEMKALESKCLVFQDSQELWTYPGLLPTIRAKFPYMIVHPIQFKIPEPNPFWNWAEEPDLKPYPYQLSSKDLLLQIVHGGVEIGTGLGKSLIILLLIRHLGLRTVVMAPGESIANQLYTDLVAAFGSKHVGFFGDGKKVSKKRITVAIGASLTRIKPGSQAWKDLSQTQCFIADESHLCPAATLENVCHGLVAAAPWRFFFSATQMRGDGLDLLLQAITGPIVFRMTVKEGIDQGYLAELFFYLVKIKTQITSESGDPNDDTRDHLYYNSDVNRKAGQLASYFFQKENCRILILIKELEQFSKLLPFLGAEARLAHGGVTKENKDTLPEAYWKSDPVQLVKDFNDEKFPILVGTSCISTGTNVKANEVTINLTGGKSEIQVWQGPKGRSTRLFTFKDGRKKTRCRVIDFDVVNSPTVHRHTEARVRIYRESGPLQEV